MTDQPLVAVTGAAGYLGSRVLMQLQQDHPDWDLRGLDNFYLGDVRRVEDLSVERVDIRERYGLEDALAGADVVIHLAAISGVDDCEADPDLGYEVNVIGTSNVAWYCRKAGAALTFPLSMAVVGDPQSFPITVEHPRAPLNWYGRTKLLGERLIETMATEAFPAHQLMVSNLFGIHKVEGSQISKQTVLNIFADQARSGGPLTVYEPGTQARNYVHVRDVADAFVKSAETLLSQRAAGETGSEALAIAGEEDPSVLDLATRVQTVAMAEGHDIEIEIVENPRSHETLVDQFAVDIHAARERLGWAPELTVEDGIRELL